MIATPLGNNCQQYNNLDLSAAISASAKITNAFWFDPIRRLCKTQDPRSNCGYLYYQQGLLCSTTNALQQTNGFTYDFNARQLTVTYADGTTTTKRYNLVGQLTNCYRPN